MEVYLDHAATTPICEAAKQAILEHIDDYGNPSSSHELGRKSRIIIEDARERIAKCINAEPEEIYFTSCGSEANTWALNYKFVLASNMEHHSIKPSYAFSGCEQGVIAPEHISDIIQMLRRQEKFLHIVTCMYVNNEIGTINDIKSIAEVTHKYGLQFHADAVQAVGHIPVDVKDIDCDTLSMSGHKFESIKGIGALYVKNGIKLNPLINGGKQERSMRPGTENILGIVSMAAALEDAVEHMEERDEYVKNLRNELISKLELIDGAHINGPYANRTASNINIRFDGVPGAQLVSLCSLYGVYISSGSACNEGIPKPSHVLKAIGLSDEEALSSIRITIGHENTFEQIAYAADTITNLVERIRANEE